MQLRMPLEIPGKKVEAPAAPENFNAKDAKFCAKDAKKKLRVLCANSVFFALKSLKHRRCLIHEDNLNFSTIFK